ncbi:hypothetical protein [Streptomyces hygroscopicus]|uniref:hypothetical protein n=1 Tax=Streptomyces hygroscopicus TaxID=1912 RepID=UPI00076719FC|nr:hypothetical protein [Streptomyces hygroscopicus]
MHQPTPEQRDRLRQAAIRSGQCYADVAQARAQLAQVEAVYSGAEIELTRAINDVLYGDITADTAKSGTP